LIFFFFDFVVDVFLDFQSLNAAPPPSFPDPPGALRLTPRLSAP
jgi:hypothetical protein